VQERETTPRELDDISVHSFQSPGKKKLPVRDFKVDLFQPYIRYANIGDSKACRQPLAEGLIVARSLSDAGRPEEINKRILA
jgi:hypothetical protein